MIPSLRFAAVPKQDACHAGGGNIITVDIAAAKAVGAAVPVSETERIPLLEADGRVLARDVNAQIDLPPFDNAAMDGYAIRRRALKGDGPWALPVLGRVAAGDTVPGTGNLDGAVRIFTGAAVPQGFDAVIMQERCERVSERIVVHERPREGEHIRRAGEDVVAGTCVLAAGTLLAPQRLALLAGLGLAEVEVVRKVRVGLISTGSELREPGEPLSPGQIYNSNRVMIRTMLGSCPWAEVIDYGIVPDRREALCDTFGQAASQCDVLVSTGGVSAGDEDHVVWALGRQGGSLDVLKVAMRPGKPVKIGMIGPMLFAGLPGNPNATLVTFRQIALPAIKATAGLRDIHPAWFPAAAGFTYAKKRGRTEYVPVRVAGRDVSGAPVLEMLGRGSSANLGVMALAEGIALLPPEADVIEEGMPLRFEPFCHC